MVIKNLHPPFFFSEIWVTCQLCISLVLVVTPCNYTLWRILCDIYSGSSICKFSKRLAAYRRSCSTTSSLLSVSWTMREVRWQKRDPGNKVICLSYSSYLVRRILVEPKRLWRDQTTWPKSDIRLVTGMISNDLFVFLATRNFTSTWGPNPKWASEKDPVLPCSSTTNTVL